MNFINFYQSFRSYFHQYSHYCVLIFFLYLFPLSRLQDCMASDYNFVTMNNLNEVFSESVNCFLQDNEGFLWVGTTNGLYRYNSNTFRKFFHTPGYTSSVSSNNIKTLAEDEEGNIWIGTQNGLNRFNKISERFYWYFANDSLPNSLSNNNISDLLLLEDGGILIGTQSGLDIAQKNKNDTYYFSNFLPDSTGNPLSSEQSIQSMLIDTHKNIWVGTWGGGLLKFDKDHGTFYQYLPQSIDLNLNNRVFSELVELNDSVIIVGSYSGAIYTFNINQLKFEPLKFSNKLTVNATSKFTRIYDLLVDTEGKLWVGATEGLAIYDFKKQTFLYEGAPFDISLNPHKVKDHAQSIYQGINNEIWVGYSEYGIDVYNNQGKTLNKWHFHLSNGSNYRNYLRSFVPHKNHNELWLGTWGNGLILSTKQGSVIARYFPSEITNNKSSDIITDIQPDSKNNLWVATNYGLFYFNIKSRSFDHIILADKANENSFSDNHFFRLINNGNDNYYVISQESIRLFNGKTFESKKDTIIEKTGIQKIINLMIDSKSNYWIATLKGLYYVDSKTKTQRVYKSDPYKYNSIKGNSIMNLYEDHNNNIWIGTSTGLSILNPLTDSILNFPESPQAFSNISGIVQDKNQRIWVLTSKSLLVFNPDYSLYTFFTEDDGLSIHAHHLSMMENNVYILDENGFYRIIADSLKVKNQEVPVYFSDFYIDGKVINTNEIPLNDTSIRYKNRIELKYKNNNPGFSFIALNYKQSEEQYYSYKLEGFNDDWINSGTRNYISFTNLKAGTYTFMVKTSPDNETWSNTFATIKLKVLPAPWKTWWAYMLYVLIIISLALLYRFITINIEREKSKSEIEQLKLQFFINISHELRTPLTLITGPLERLLKNENLAFRNKIEMIHRNATRMQQLVNQILDLRKVDVGKLRPVIFHQDLHEFFSQLLVSFRDYSEDKQIAFDVNYDSQTGKVWMDPDMLEKIISNLLINAFKFTPKGKKVTLSAKRIKYAETDLFYKEIKNTMFSVHQTPKSIKPSTDYLSIKITDSGKGIDKTELESIFERFYQNKSTSKNVTLSTGVGLSLCKDLINLLHGYLFVQSKPETGSEFLILIPIGIEAFNNDYIFDEAFTFGDTHKDYSKFIKASLKEKDKEQPASNAGFDELTYGRYTVMVVEDNIELLNHIKEIISDQFNVITAPDGEIALKYASEEVVDLIVSDIMMPKIDGLELCKTIKSNIETSHIPVILLTAKTAIEYELKGLSIGADDYIQKPFNSDILIQRISNMLKARKEKWNKIAKEDEILLSDGVFTNTEEDFLKNALEIVDKYLSDPKFSQEQFCNEIGMSKASLYRKLKALTGQSINEFISNVRLRKAAEILRLGKQVQIAQLSYNVGFSEPSYFSKKFRELYGITPKAYNNKHLGKTISNN